MIVRLLHTGMHVPPISRRRLWVAPNQTVHLVAGASFTLSLTGTGAGRLTLAGPDPVALLPLSPFLHAPLGLWIIPRAVEIGAANWPMRYLMEIALAQPVGPHPALHQQEVTKP